MSLLIATACVAGLTLYTESVHLPPLKMMLFSGGALAVIGGIVVLSAADAQREEEEIEEEEMDETCRIGRRFTTDSIASTISLKSPKRLLLRLEKQAGQMRSEHTLHPTVFGASSKSIKEEGFSELRQQGRVYHTRHGRADKGGRDSNNEGSSTTGSSARAPNESNARMNVMLSKSAALFKRLVENRKPKSGRTPYSRLHETAKEGRGKARRWTGEQEEDQSGGDLGGVKNESSADSEGSGPSSRSRDHLEGGGDDLRWLAEEEEEEDFEDLEVVVIEDPEARKERVRVVGNTVQVIVPQGKDLRKEAIGSPKSVGFIQQSNYGREGRAQDAVGRTDGYEDLERLTDGDSGRAGITELGDLSFGEEIKPEKIRVSDNFRAKEDGCESNEELGYNEAIARTTSSERRARGETHAATNSSGGGSNICSPWNMVAESATSALVVPSES